MLSRITEPTAGEIRLYGRVGSLLEVGTGFHPELTGRENVYLNGSILGMRRREIDRQFDAIVAFAGIEKFLDTPVKRYSSGMYVRLAFAVAAHLESEILIVDEVLAVGDADFQRKCLDKMQDVAGQGRTVLFVSHNMGLLQQLCQRGILLQNHRIALDAPIKEAVNAYLETLSQASVLDVAQREDRRGKGETRLTRVEITGNGAIRSETLTTGAAACFTFHLSTPLPGVNCNFTIYDHVGQPLTGFNSAIAGPEDERQNPASQALICELDELLLSPGRYRINVAVYAGAELQDHLEGAATFDVEPGQVAGRPINDRNAYSAIVLPHRWRVTAPRQIRPAK